MTAIPKAITEKGENLITRVITLYNIQTVGFSTKNYRTFKKKQENTVFAEKEEFCRNCPWGIQELLVKGCKSTLSNMLKELQEIKRMLREWIANVNKNTILKNKKPNRKSGICKYSNWNRKFNKRVQRQVWACKRKNQQTWI